MKTFAHPMPARCGHPLCAGDQVCEGLFDRWEFTVECISCPLAITGKGNGQPFYFRARHDRWRLELDGTIIGSGGTDDFTVPSAIELIMKAVDQWIWQEA